MPSWDLWRSFLAVCRERSLSAAARRLRLTQPTLSRHIAELEASLSAALFTRSPQGLIPTDVAVALIGPAEAMEAAALAAERGARRSHDGALTGVVRVTASEVVGAELLPGMLASFCDAEPGVRVELALNNAVEDLLRRDADIAIRMTEPTQAALLSKRVGRVRLGFHAHRRYLEAHGAPDSLEALLSHRLIGFDRITVSAESLGPAAAAFRREQFTLRTDSDLAQLAAIRAGFGIGVCQTGIAKREPDLVPVLQNQVSFQLETWIVMHEDLKASPPVRRLYEHLERTLSAYLAAEG